MRDEGPRAPRSATLQVVLDALAEQFAVGDMEADLYRDTRSSILSYCRAVGKPASKLKADIVELLDRLDESSALREGLLPRRFSNLKSLLRRSLNLAGIEAKRARRNKPLSPEWNQLLSGCADRDLQTRLRPFAGDCTDRGIAPADVDEAVLQAYEAEVRLIARSRNPADTMKKLRRCWNKLVDTYPDQLTFRSAIWKTPLGWAYPLDEMPKSFQKEMALLKKARSPETYEEVFRCRPLKHEKAVIVFCATIMRIVAIMVGNGHAPSKIGSLRYLVEPAHFEATIRGLKDKTGASELSQLNSYVSVIHWLADTWVKLSAGKMRSLKSMMKIVGQRKAEISDSSLDVLEQLDDPVKQRKAKMLCDTVFAEFSKMGEAATPEDARAFRDALFWELGLTTGWRPSSRARIDLEEDIRWTGRKGREIATLKAPKTAEKTELRLKVELPSSTSRMLRVFIDSARPLLIAKGDEANPHLFTGRFGGHICTTQLSKMSAKLIARRTLVVGATGHKSRHAAVKFHLSENPGDWQTVQEHVGHRDPETTKRFYGIVTQVESSKRVQKSLGKRKR